jgi:hypothetical protein
VEGRDWPAVVAAGECPDCHFDATALARDRFPAEIRAESARWRAALEKYGDDEPALRSRHLQSWSVLEYACHVRDVFEIMAGRIRVMLDKRDPTLPWWDHEEAADEHRYNFQDPFQVAIDLETNARNLSAMIARVGDESWARTGIRGDGARFTIDGIVRYTLHESHHHRWDAQRAAAAR